MTTSKPRVLVARAIPPQVLQFLQQHFVLQTNEDDTVWSHDELIARLQGMDGVLTTGTERIDAQLLAAIRETIWAKPREHHFNDSSMPATRGMYRIGG